MQVAFDREDEEIVNVQTTQRNQDSSWSATKRNVASILQSVTWYSSSTIYLHRRWNYLCSHKIHGLLGV